jgi:hypothetical protein
MKKSNYYIKAIVLDKCPYSIAAAELLTEK